MSKTVTVDITSSWSKKVLFSAKVDASAGKRLRVKAALEIAVNDGANLRDADLRGANLRSANLGGANLRSADLHGAYLGDADLGGADLRGADLRSANLRSADLRSAYLRGAYLHGAYLGDADLGGADLRGADLRSANLGGANLRSADLRGAYLHGAYLGEGVFCVDGGCERRGYSFFTLYHPEKIIIRGGCHEWGTFEEAKAHYGDSYTSDGDRRECLARLTLMENEVKRRATLTKEGEK